MISDGTFRFLGAKLESIENRPAITRPTNCTTEYVKLVIDENEDLDFEIKYRYGDVQYNIRRILHYIKDSGITKLGGTVKILKSIDVYEIEIYHNNDLKYINNSIFWS